LFTEELSEGLRRLLEKADRLEVFERATPQVRGVLTEQETIKCLTIRQFAPTVPEHLPWLEHVWSVAWDIPAGLFHEQRTVPFPAFNLVADSQQSAALYGCTSGCFAYSLKQQGHVIGIRFKPAFQSVFFDNVASDLTDTSVNARNAFSRDAVAILEQLASQGPEIHGIETLLDQLQRDAGPISKDARRMNQMAGYIETQPNVYRVADLVRAFNLSERSIQRHFHAHLGMSPKSVIERFRIQSAINHAAGERNDNFAALALRLGYFDQAHFINAFRHIIGHSPTEFARLRRAATEPIGVPPTKS
jgi:AraC-like DNA-binding protein